MSGSDGEQEEQVPRWAVASKPASQRVSSSGHSCGADGHTDLADLAEVATANAPHLLRSPEVPYEVAIPTLGRWRPACVVNPHERCLKHVTRPFILEKSLAFLGRHGVPQERVTLFVADSEEAENYRNALKGSSWDGTRVVVGVRGILAQRNFIVRYFPAGTFVLSVDDDVSNIFWKFSPGKAYRLLRPLPCGALLPLIFDAHQRMLTYKAFICGLNSTASKNLLNMHVDGISTRNGEINGFFYFFINRHEEELLPCVADATEDAERSLRYFRKDSRVLRYRMYCGETRCFQNRGGLQCLYGDWGEKLQLVNERRKTVEREAATRLHHMFPGLTGKPKEKKTLKTLEIHFLPKGGCPIPSTTLAEFEKNYKAERTPRPVGETVCRRRRASRAKQKEAPEEQAPQEPIATKSPKPAPAEYHEERVPEEHVAAKSPKPEYSEWSLELPGVDAIEVVSTTSSSCSSTDEDFDDLLQPEEEAEVVLSSDSGSEHGDNRIADEDHQLLEAMRRSRVAEGEQGPKSPQDELIKAILRSINGDAVDPVAAALEASVAVSEAEAAQRAEEAVQLEKALASSAAEVEEDARQLAEVLGFSKEVCAEALRVNGGSVDAAAAALLERGGPPSAPSGEPTGGTSPSRDQPQSVDLAASPTGASRKHSPVSSPSRKRSRVDDHG